MTQPQGKPKSILEDVAEGFRKGLLLSIGIQDELDNDRALIARKPDPRSRRLTKAEQIEKTKDWPQHDPNPNNCTGRGHTTCLRQGEHSWFNHSMDSYFEHPELSNLPEGFVEP